MDVSVSPLPLAHLMLEGAVIAVCIELILRFLFVPRGQKSWLIRGLKITMGTAMTIKSAIFSTFSSNTLGDNCRLAGRIAGSSFHVSSVAGLCILLLRVKAIVPAKYRTLAVIFHYSALAVRCALGISDVIVTQIWTDPTDGTCRYKDMHQIGIVYTMMDTVMDAYVSTVITIILVSHIRKLHSMGIGENLNLYISVVLSNVIRTTILSILNLVCTVYFIVGNESLITTMILWPVNNLFFVALIGYDTDITNSIRQLRSIVCTATTAASRRPSPHSNSEYRGSLSTMFSEPTSIANQNNVDIKSTTVQHHTRSHRCSSFLVLNEEDDEENLSKVPGSSTREDESSITCTILNMAAQNDINSHHMSCPTQ